MTAAEPATGVLARRAFDRILLIKLSAVGDVVHALPVLAGLRARFPTSRIASRMRCPPAKHVECCLRVPWFTIRGR